MFPIMGNAGYTSSTVVFVMVLLVVVFIMVVMVVVVLFHCLVGDLHWFNGGGTGTLGFWVLLMI